MPIGWINLAAVRNSPAFSQLSTFQLGVATKLARDHAELGWLPTDDVRLAKLLGISVARWRRVKPAIAEFFHDDWTPAEWWWREQDELPFEEGGTA